MAILARVLRLEIAAASLLGVDPRPTTAELVVNHHLAHVIPPHKSLQTANAAAMEMDKPAPALSSGTAVVQTDGVARRRHTAQLAASPASATAPARAAPPALLLLRRPPLAPRARPLQPCPRTACVVPTPAQPVVEANGATAALNSDFVALRTPTAAQAANLATATALLQISLPSQQVHSSPAPTQTPNA